MQTLTCVRWFRVGSLTLLLAGPVLALAGAPKKCVTTEDATQLLNKDICVSAHVYNIAEMPDGTRFLDICSPETTDENCHFTIVSLREDRGDVGELMKYRDMNVHVRGIVQPMHGRMGLVVSHARQFSGGPPKFRPNPMLAHGFTAEDSEPPIHDPNLRSQGGARRSFMNSRDKVNVPAK
jgi:hypothetical protein